MKKSGWVAFAICCLLVAFTFVVFAATGCSGRVYRITVAPHTNGTVTTNRTTAAIGEEVRLSVVPNSGYELTRLSVNGQESAVRDSFIMPNADVVVQAVFSKISVNTDPSTDSTAPDAEPPQSGGTDDPSPEKPKSYALSATPCPYGTVRLFINQAESAEAESTARCGDGIKVALTPTEGCELQRVAFLSGGQTLCIFNASDDVPKGELSVDFTRTAASVTFMFAMPEQPITVEAVFCSSAVFTAQNGVEYTRKTDGTFCITAYRGTSESPELQTALTVTEIGERAFFKSGITSLTVPKSVTTIGAQAFARSTLRTVELPPKLETLGERAFENCRKLRSIELPSALKTLSSGVFASCSELSDVTFPLGLETVEEEAFRQCASLKLVALPDGVQKISARAFYSCRALQKIYLPSALTTLGAEALLTGGALQLCFEASATVVHAVLSSDPTSYPDDCETFYNVKRDDFLKADVAASVAC